MDEQLTSWNVADVLAATGGRLVQGGEPLSFSGISIDSRAIHPKELFVAITGDVHDGHDFIEDALDKGALGVLVSDDFVTRGMPSRKKRGIWIAVPDTRKALGDLATFRRRKLDVSVVAITGTNGKTTTKEMVSSVLEGRYSILKTKGNLNNLIGLPLTLLGLNENHEWAVLELGMNRPGEIRRLAQISIPDIGIITNIGHGHLEGVKDIDGVMQAKGELFQEMARGNGGFAIVNGDDQRAVRVAKGFTGQVVTFGITSSGLDVRGVPRGLAKRTNSFELFIENEKVMIQLPIPGIHNIYNALAAAAVGQQLGLSLEVIKNGLEKVAPIKGRMEIIPLRNGVHLIDDTYNANPDSMAAALKSLHSLKGKGRAVLVAGDMRELGEHARQAHRDIGIMAARMKTSLLFLTGKFAKDLAEGAISAGMESKDIFLGSHEAILDDLRGRLTPGDWILVKGSRAMAMERVVEGILELNKEER